MSCNTRQPSSFPGRTQPRACTCVVWEFCAFILDCWLNKGLDRNKVVATNLSNVFTIFFLPFSFGCILSAPATCSLSRCKQMFCPGQQNYVPLDADGSPVWTQFSFDYSRVREPAFIKYRGKVIFNERPVDQLRGLIVRIKNSNDSRRPKPRGAKFVKHSSARQQLLRA
jgi:hypothetical protein